MLRMTPREIFVRRAWDLLDTPYTWGGKSVLRDGSLDCSGLVGDCLRTALGHLPYDSIKNANGQYEFWEKAGLLVAKPHKRADLTGRIVFWWNTKKTRIAHVEIMITNDLSIGARGDSRATSLEEAKKYDMRAKSRKTFGRSREIAGFVDPFRLEEI